MLISHFKIVFTSSLLFSYNTFMICEILLYLGTGLGSYFLTLRPTILIEIEWIILNNIFYR